MRFLRIGLLLSVVATTGVSAEADEAWLAIEGGGAFFSADPVQAYGVATGVAVPFVDRLLNVHDGSYGRLEVAQFPGGGGVGPFGGVGLLVQGWRGTASVAEATYGGSLLGAGTGVSCSGGCGDFASTMSRSYFEASPQLFKRLSPAAILGVEPFVGVAGESVVSSGSSGSFTRTSDIAATAVGVLLSLQRGADLGGNWRMHFRAAAAGYVMNARIDTTMDGVTGTPPPRTRSYSDSFGGVRGQLAVALDYAISPMLAIGVVGRVDYWSAYPTFRSPDFGTPGVNNAPESASHNHLLGGFVGVRLVATLGQ